MDKKLDIHQALRVITKVIELGEKRGEENLLHGLYASEGFDGYKVRLHDDYVGLNIDFHNKYNLDSSDPKTLELFLTKLHDIDAKYNHTD